MSKATVVFVAALLLLGGMSWAVDFGVFAGSTGKPATFTPGLALDVGFFLPFTRLEVEGCKLGKSGFKTLSAGVKLQPNLAAFIPYAVVGAGCEFEKFDLLFRDYHYFTFIGGGLHVKVFPAVSLRGDARVWRFKGLSRLRLSAGIFVHL